MNKIETAQITTGTVTIGTTDHRIAARVAELRQAGMNRLAAHTAAHDEILAEQTAAWRAQHAER